MEDKETFKYEESKLSNKITQQTQNQEEKDRNDKYWKLCEI